MDTAESNQHEDDLKIQMKLSHNLGFLDKKEKLKGFKTQDRATGDITIEIIEHITDLTPVSESGWQRELNIVRWCDLPPRYDIRDWNQKDHSKMTRGTTLTEDEMRALTEGYLAYKFVQC